MRALFMDVADLAIIVRAAKNLRLKRISLATAKEKLDAWREETLECQSFETWLEEDKQDQNSSECEGRGKESEVEG